MNETKDLNVFNIDKLMASIDNPTGKQLIVNGFDENEREALKKPELTEGQANLRAAAFVIVFLAGIIAAIVFSQTEPMLCISSIGAIFLIIGLISLFQGGLSLDSLPALILPLVGALMTGIPIIMLYHRDHPESVSITRDDVITLILGCMAFLGLMLMIVPNIRHSSKMKSCTQRVMAKCIYLDIHFSSHHDARGRTVHTNLYAPTWQYEIGDFLYVTREPIFTDCQVPSIGEQREILFDPGDPSQIYRPVKRNTRIEMFIGLMFFVLSLTAIYFFKFK